MAAIQERKGSYRVQFNYRGKQFGFTIGRVSEAEARAKAAQIDYLLMRLKQGLIEMPAGADVVDFFRYDGAPSAGVLPSPASTVAEATGPTLGDLRDRYLDTHVNGSLEAHTLKGIRRHFGHLARILGEGFPIRGLKLADLQGYVDKRAKAKGRRGALLPTTIKKEIVTLRTAWNWGSRMGIVEGRCPVDGLRYAKGDEKPPFQTRAEIERQLPGLLQEKADELWEVLYLTFEEVGRLLDHVKATAGHPWIYPLVATAAHTGARRGELLRMRVADLDLEAGVVIIRERKRAHGRRTTRRVPLSTTLKSILPEWLKVHPGGGYLFAQAVVVGRSKKRSPRTGYRSKDRPTTEKARRAAVRIRERPALVPLTEDEARHHLKHTLAGSEWDVVRGYHVLRHSFVSACASRGVDLRMLQEWCGHMSPEMQRRYMHLYPNVQAEAIESVFG
jgi:integrase